MDLLRARHGVGSVIPDPAVHADLKAAKRRKAAAKQAAFTRKDNKRVEGFYPVVGPEGEITLGLWSDGYWQVIGDSGYYCSNQLESIIERYIPHPETDG